MVDLDTSKQSKQIADLRAKELEQVAERIAKATGIPYIDLTSVSIETDALGIIPEEKARELKLAGFKLVGKNLYIAISNPQIPNLKAELQKYQDNHGYTIGLYICSPNSLEKAWTYYEDFQKSQATKANLLEISAEIIKNIKANAKNNSDVKKIFEESFNKEEIAGISDLLDILVGGALVTSASDIHIDPQEETVQVKYRQDGILQDIVQIDYKTYKKINSRIKILSHLKLTQESKAQDGRFTINNEGKEIEVRTSIIPGAYGEAIVMRILNPEMIEVNLEKLGIEPRLFKILSQEISKPNGLIITTGPTGSGKTTTLYAFLKKVYDPGLKMLTIEDPIEYHLNGITQTQVETDKGYTFASGLRGALRQDPDTIMVGEIRDSETAEIAVNASLTGHIVFSTLHTNNAAGAIPRLIDLKVNPKIIPSSLSVALAQRLVRKLVPECKVAYKPEKEIEDKIRKILIRAEKNKKDLGSYGVKVDQEIILYRPGENCNIGNGTGYKGRIGIFEAILMDENIEKIINTNPSEREIRKVADKQGLLTMQEDAVLKMLAGVTSYEEISGVVDLDEYLNDPVLEDSALTQEPPVIINQGTVLLNKKTEPETNTSQPNSENLNNSPLLKEKNSEPVATTPLPATQMNESNLADELLNPAPPQATLSDHIRDAELVLLIEKLKILEKKQAENPSENVVHAVQKIRDLIIDIVKNHPPRPRLSIDADGSVVKNELSFLVNELLDIETDQILNPNKSASDDLKNIRQKLEIHTS